MNYALDKDGDSFEQHYHGLFIKNNFPNYENFWQTFVVPLTNRPTDIHFKNDKELAQIGKTANDVCIAQLHYSILRHLARAYDLAKSSMIDQDILAEGVVHISGSLDIAFELLERFLNPSKYDPWLEEKDRVSGKIGGKEARKVWQNNRSYPLQSIKDYRNHLIHGRMTPSIINSEIYLPRIGFENKYFDWRLITDPTKVTYSVKDFMSAREILRKAWIDSIKYLNVEWKKTLLK